MNIEENVRKVQENIRAAAKGREVILVAATKMNDADTIRRAIAAGIDASGENRVQEMMDKLDMSLVPEHHVWYVRDNCYTTVEKPSEYFLANNVALEKMNIYGIPEAMQQEIYDAVTATGFIKHTRPGAGPNLEFAHHTLNKLNAVDAILNKLGITYEETLAIGDSSSDVEIIKACGVGIAMGNAPDNIKAIADDVTGLNTDDGLAQAFEKYVEKHKSKKIRRKSKMAKP